MAQPPIRISPLDIESQLLRGEVLEWEDNKTGKRRFIRLEFARQRRLFKLLLDSPIRTARGLPSSFIESLKQTYRDGNDPAVTVAATASSSFKSVHTWFLRKIE